MGAVAARGVARGVARSAMVRACDLRDTLC